MAKALYPGSFDPITNGHFDIICRALTVVDKLVIAPAVDISKIAMFDIEERVQMVRDELSLLCEQKRNRVEVIPFSGLLTNFAEEIGAKVLIRGLRAVSDFDYEFQMTCMNRRLDEELETIFLMASEKTQFVSSRFVKEICKLGGDISSVVSPNVERKLCEHFGRAK